MKTKLIFPLAFLMLSLFSTTLSAQYCTTGGASNPYDSNIESVSLLGDAATFITHTGCNGTVGELGIGDSTLTQIVNVTAGSAYTANIQFGTCGGNYGSVGEAWIDWNQNDAFDASESIGTWTGTPPTTLSAFAFTVPVGAYNGATRMRVIQWEGGNLPLNPCGSFTYGSAVDFTVVVSGGITLTCPAPSSLTSNTPTTTSINLAWTENGSAPSWQIEYGPLGFSQGTG
ncbi:MAG: hypothetical protein JKY54_06710, partial [Flavobacteriales bacterium]|nr:hypothetical protein [Flavobacteriales bacterium]